MLSNKIAPDPSRAGNENSAHIGRGGRYQEMMPASAYSNAGAKHDPGRQVEAGEIVAPPVRGDQPMTLDPHSNARHSNENRSVHPKETARSARTAEINDRLRNFGRTRT